MKLTYHAQVERIDRIANILATTGFGEVCRTRYSAESGKRICLTTTGVTLILDRYEDVLVTAYYADLKHTAYVYGDDRVPEWLVKTIKRNFREHRAKYREFF